MILQPSVMLLNNMGGIKSVLCNQIAFDIWQYCIGKNMWISAAFMPGNINKTADYKSRNFKDNTEWQLKPAIISQVVKNLSCVGIAEKCFDIWSILKMASVKSVGSGNNCFSVNHITRCRSKFLPLGFSKFVLVLIL